MRVLWLTNTMSGYCPLNNSSESQYYNGGGWISAAETEIIKNNDIQLAIGFLMDNQPFKAIQHDICYYPIPHLHHSIWYKPINLYDMLCCNDWRHEKKRWSYFKQKFQTIINDFHPDVIHVWGSESYMGLVSFISEVPVCLHIQGILNPCWNAFLPPFISWAEMGGRWWQLGKQLSLKIKKIGWNESCFRETAILRHINYYFGRTEWDYRITKIFNHDAQYFTVNEMLRAPFYHHEVQRCLPNKLTIVSTISSPLYKGFDLLLKTAKLIKEYYDIEFEWKVYGNVDPRIIEKRFGMHHEEVNIELLGVATADELKAAVLNATLYFHPSYIDNSPNSVCEAQMLGLPVVATNVGGVSSIVRDHVDGFLVPANDPYQSAFHIIELYTNCQMNVSMGLRGQERAMKRHDKKQIMDAIFKAYECILRGKKYE